MSSLLLFDIDGTLVRKTGPHHRQALVDAIRRVTGLDSTTDGIPVHGMLDPDILTQMLQRAGVDAPAIEAAMPAIVTAAEEAYLQDVPDAVPDLSDKCCPGVHPVLEALTKRGVILALVTGNLTRIGWHKLSRAGLAHYFRLGAFGEMAKTRGGLARIAIERARVDGFIGPGAKISLIGDASQDVIAARQNGIQSIAVRTGITPPAELEGANPDILLDDLTHLDLSII